MKYKVKNTLGIDISSSSIAVASVKLDKDGMHLVHAARQAMPEGLLDGGLIQNPKVFKQILSSLKRKCRSTRSTTLSLWSSRSLVQILDIPGNISLNMGQFVQREIKNYVNMAGVKTVSDYRSLDTSDTVKRAFVAVGENKSVTEAVNLCQDLGLDVQRVEPSLLAYVRALYHKTVADRFGCNVMMAIIQDDQVSLVVLRDRAIDFIRTHSMAGLGEDPAEMGNYLAKKIKMVMQYYEVEVPQSSHRWEINVVSDDLASFSDQARTVLCQAMGDIPVEVITSENFPSLCSVDISENIPLDQVSMAAVGFAMQSLAEDIPLPQINLLPLQIREVKDVKRGMLLTAISVATVLLFMGLLSIGIVVKANEVADRIAGKRPQSAVGDVVKIRGELESQIEQVGKIPTVLKEKMETQKSVNWVGVLSDIMLSKPSGVCLTSVDSRNDYAVFLEGMALTYGDVTQFVARLSQSESIAAANLIKTDHKSGASSYHVYEIKCELVTTTGI